MPKNPILQVWLVSPPGYTHASALFEVAQAFSAALYDLGHDTRFVTDPGDIVWHQRTLVFGAHLLRQSLPCSFIIYNSEQIDAESHWKSEEYLNLLRYHEVWDYSQSNIKALRYLGIEAEHIPIGYHPSMSKIENSANPDIDCLFYGSINERRSAILDTLKAAGIRITTAFNSYGVMRDALIARSKVVLNMHYYDSKIFEVFRAAHLLANKKAIVSEIGLDKSLEEPYAHGIRFVDASDIAVSVARLIADTAEREALALKGYTLFKERPLVEILRSRI